MCAEAVWWQCHRRIIADYLIAADEMVFHIMGADRVKRAEMTEGAKRERMSALGQEASCNQTACGASCEQNEQILNAYALNPGGAIGFIDERNVTFRPKERPTVLVLACIAK
jgi:hypothetical protein